MKAILCFGLIVAVTLTGCSSGGSKSNTSSSSTLSSIEISPNSMSIGMGSTQTFTATGHFSDGSSSDITATAKWTSSDSTIASISGPGVAIGYSVGTATITADSGGLHATATLKVATAAANLVSISVSPAASSIPVNTSQQFSATGSYSDGSSADITNVVSWSSSALPMHRAAFMRTPKGPV